MFHKKQQSKYKYIVPVVAAIISFFIVNALIGHSFLDESNDEMIGVSYKSGNTAQWYNFKTFTGYQTNIDPTKLPEGGNPMGQNTTINNGDRISVREFGYEVFPEGEEISTSTDSIKSLHNFRKRSGENILIRTSSTTMEYFEENNDLWEIFRTGLTSSKKFSFADYNINTDIQSYTYFGNAYDNAARWTGVHALLSVDLNISDTFVYVSHVDESESFLLANGTIIVCGVELDYTAFDDVLDRFTLTSASTVSCSDGRSVAEAVEEFLGCWSHASFGNVRRRHGRRLRAMD